MKKAKKSVPSFLSAVLLNMLFRWEWLLFALIALALHRWLGLPLIVTWILLGVWVIWSVIVTWFVTWAAGTEDATAMPGGQRTSERMRSGKIPCTRSDAQIHHVENHKQQI